MKALEPHDRPREKLWRVGAGALGDNELVAVVLGHGGRHAHALDLASQTLEALGGVAGLCRGRPAEIARMRGLGPAGAARLLAAIELGRRAIASAWPPRTRLASPREVAGYLLPRFGAVDVEQFGVVLLDVRHRVVASRVLTRGTLDTAPVHPRDVFREAVAAGAFAVVIFHNHPSGDPSPSPADHALTARMWQAGEIMGIEVVDHVILGDNTFCSMRELGALPGARRQGAAHAATHDTNDACPGFTSPPPSTTSTAARTSGRRTRRSPRT
jgi:DNA repair protein RadC